MSKMTPTMSTTIGECCLHLLTRLRWDGTGRCFTANKVFQQQVFLLEKLEWIVPNVMKREQMFRKLFSHRCCLKGPHRNTAGPSFPSVCVLQCSVGVCSSTCTEHFLRVGSTLNMTKASPRIPHTSRWPSTLFMLCLR